MWKNTKWCLLTPDANDGGTPSVPQETPVSADSAASQPAKGEVTTTPVDRAGLLAQLTKLAPPVEEQDAQVEPTEEEPPAEVETDAKLDEEVEEKVEDEKPLPFHEHPRWKEKQQEVVTLKSELEAVKPVAQRMGQIETYCAKQGITQEQFGQALEMAALLNNDPIAAFKRIQEISGQLAQYTGDSLPADLQKQVDDGLLPVDTAKLMVKLQNENALLRKQDQVKQQRTQAEVVATRQQAMVQAVSAWEQSTMGRDPDYARKAELVEGQLTRLLQVNPPKNAEEAVALAVRAYDAVNKSLGTFTKVETNGKSRPTLDTKRQTLAPPKSALEVAQRAAAKHVR